MRFTMQRGILTVVVAAGLVGMGAGCATGRPMAFAPEAPPLALGPQQGLALATLKISNAWKTGCQPHAKSLVVRPLAAEGADERFQTSPFRASAAENDQWEEVLVTLPLAPGGYQFGEIAAKASCGIVFGNGVVPVNAPFRVEPGKAVYVGRVEALRRERKGDEPRAGSLIPLIDQAVTGFSGGTFDVRVVDAFAADVQALKATYPPLANMPIEQAPMGPRAVAAP